MVAIEERVEDLEGRVSRLEGVIEQINLRLEDITSRMTAIETRMNVHIALTFGIWASVVGLLLVIMFRI